MRNCRDIKTPAKGGGEEAPCLELCPDFTLRVEERQPNERLVTVEGEGIAEFFNRAEDVEGCKVSIHLPPPAFVNKSRWQVAHPPVCCRIR